MNAAERHEESTKALGSLAREALEAAGGNTEKAIDRILRLLKNDKVLLRQIVEAAVADAVFHRVQSNVRNQRYSIVATIDRQNAAAQTIDRARDKSRVIVLAEAISSCLLDMPLAGGQKLRDAGRVEVMAQIERYEKQAGNMTHKARWLRLILEKIPGNKRVGSVITETTALELFEKTRTEQAMAEAAE